MVYAVMLEGVIHISLNLLVLLLDSTNSIFPKRHKVKPLMELREYLKRNGLTQDQFVKKVERVEGVTIPQGTLSKWINGQRIPRKDDMLLIYDVTDHSVTPNDFVLQKRSS